jgi:GNAT superfamily N-acetyltransferase
MRDDRPTVDDATEGDADDVARLFDAYRVFYDRSSDVEGARRFITARLERRTTRFFLARIDAAAVGFVHLLPSFDTLAMRPMWILEDLFVEPSYRRRGVGSALLRHAEQFARDNGAGRISLTTAHTNATAQHLYVAEGYEADTVFRTYHRTLG